VNVTDVRFDIEHHTNAYTGKGALTTVEVDRLVRLAAVADANAVTPDSYIVWAPSAAYTLDTRRVPSQRTGYVYRVTTAGTSGATEPATWPTVIGQTVTDGTVVWTADAVAPWLGAWNVFEAAATGCEWRATKLADNFTVALGSGKSFNRMETPMFWLDRAKQLRQRGGIGVITLRSVYAS
jgi:hypothetical protein